MHDMTEAFLKGNAKPDYIASKLADVLRDLMRATAVKHDHISPVGTAAESWKQLLQLLERCEEPVSWGLLFEGAVSRLRDDGRPQGDDISEALREVARTGMSLYIEKRGGFSSVKDRAFLAAIDHLEETRRRHIQTPERKEIQAAVYPERRKGRLTKNWIVEVPLLGKNVRRRFATQEDAEQWASSIKHM